MIIEKKRRSVDELDRIFDEERKNYFNSFLISMAYSDIDSTTFVPYGDDSVCMEIAELELLAKDSMVAFGPDFSEEGRGSFTNKKLFYRFHQIELSISKLLNKIRDRIMTEKEYVSVLEKTHPIFREINNVVNS